MLEDLQDPSRVVVTGRAQALHPPSQLAADAKPSIMAGVFFVSLIAVFVLLDLAGAPLSAPRRQAHPGRLSRGGAVMRSAGIVLTGTVAAGHAC